MLDTEIELKNIRSVIEIFKSDLINITLEVNKSFTSKISGKKTEILYEKLRNMHQNLKAAKEAEKILIEDPPFHSPVIFEAIEMAKDKEKEKRDNHRNRIFYDDFHDKVIDSKVPSYYVNLISLVINEIFAIRDAVDPPIGRKYNNELRKIEKDILIDRFGQIIKKYLDTGWDIEQISEKLMIDKDQIEIAFKGYKKAKLENEKNQIDNNDINDRILCSDGNCIGLINKDGYCNECGKKYKG